MSTTTKVAVALAAVAALATVILHVQANQAASAGMSSREAASCIAEQTDLRSGDLSGLCGETRQAAESAKRNRNVAAGLFAVFAVGAFWSHNTDRVAGARTPSD